MKFLDKFESYCKEHKITKENGEINIAEFSRRSKIPATTISNWYINGTNNIKLSTLVKLSTFTKMSMDYWADDNIDSYNENNEILNENLNDLDNALYSKMKELNDSEKKAILGVMNAIKNDIDNEEK